MTNKTFSAFPFTMPRNTYATSFPVMNKLTEDEIQQLKLKENKQNGDISSAYSFINDGLDAQQVFTLLTAENAILFQKMYLTSMPVKYLFSSEFTQETERGIFEDYYIELIRSKLLEYRNIFTNLEEITQHARHRKHDVDTKIERISSIIIEDSIEDFI